MPAGCVSGQGGPALWPAEPQRTGDWLGRRGPHAASRAETCQGAPEQWGSGSAALGTTGGGQAGHSACPAEDCTAAQEISTAARPTHLQAPGQAVLEWGAARLEVQGSAARADSTLGPADLLGGLQAVPEAFQAALARWVQHATLPQAALVPALLQRLRARFVPGEDVVAGSGDVRAVCRIISCEEPALPANYGALNPEGVGV